LAPAELAHYIHSDILVALGSSKEISNQSLCIPGFPITTSYSVEESTHCRPTSALVVSLCDNMLAAGDRAFLKIVAWNIFENGESNLENSATYEPVF
jgi:hypothetical protein